MTQVSPFPKATWPRWVPKAWRHRADWWKDYPVARIALANGLLRYQGLRVERVARWTLLPETVVRMLNQYWERVPQPPIAAETTVRAYVARLAARTRV